jgi:hypothetical protein
MNGVVLSNNVYGIGSLLEVREMSSLKAILHTWPRAVTKLLGFLMVVVIVLNILTKRNPHNFSIILLMGQTIQRA